MRIQVKVRKLKEYRKRQPVELPVPARTGSVLLPAEHATHERSFEFLKENKERAKPAK
jgi:hypothetical protein